MIHFLTAVAFATTVLFGWLAQWIGLPGNWLIVAAAAVYVLLAPPDSVAAMGWNVVGALTLLAVLGEVAEFVAGALGVAKAGGSRRGAVLAIAGSIAGSIVGIFVGLPIPIVGSLAAAVLFGGLGALAGAFLGENWKGRDFDTSLEIGKAAFWGRLVGTLAKMVFSSMMVVVALWALFF